MAGSHGQHHRTEPEFGCDVEVDAVIDQELNRGQMARVSGQH
jgi:hypothetical protein